MRIVNAMLAAVVTVLLVVGLCLIPRRVSWRQIETPVAVVGLLVAFALGSWLLGAGAAVIGSAAERWNPRGWSAFLLVISPVLVALLIGQLVRWTDKPKPAASINQLSDAEPSAKYSDDAGWYSSEWRRDPDNADHDLGNDGYRLELLDGPLAGKTARLRDSRFRLWVARSPRGELVVRGAIEEPATRGVEPLGSYGFAHEAEAMLWRPAVPAVNNTTVLLT